jgi:hypothetical protein
MRKTTNKKTIHPTIFKAINHCTLRANGAIFFLFINMSFCAIFSLALLLTFPPIISHGKTTKTSFENRYNAIYIGKTYKYNIVNSPKKAKIKFAVSNNKLATINQNSGILYPRKKGSVTIKAFVTDINKNQKLTLKKTVKIKASKMVKKDTSEIPFSLPSTYVNSINYTVKLKAAKIMQTSEVKSSYIQLVKQKHELKGQFKNLSANGRYITYELNNDAVKQLTPGDRTMDGTYTMSCSLSSRKLNINYAEHFVGQSVTGFVMTPGGNPVENANITISNNNFTVNTTSDKNGYYNVRFPKPETVVLTVSCNNYYTRTIKDIYLKIPKSVCKNIVMHKKETSDKNSSLLSAYFNIRSYDKQPVKLEISSCDATAGVSSSDTTSNNLSRNSTADTLLSDTTANALSNNSTADAYSNSQTFTTDESGGLFISPDDALTSKKLLSDADIITLSSTNKNISHKENIEAKNYPAFSYPFLYQKKYHVKIFSSANKSLQADCEFYFSFDNFTSCNLIFDITLNQTNKTIFPLSLLPLNPGSNIDLEKINYYHADLYQIGIPAPLCYFNFCENTPANFASKINSSELYLKNGNFYYAVFRALDYTNNIILSDILAPFKIENGIMHFDDDSLIFSDNNAFDIKSKQLPILSDILLNAANLPQDSSYKNTVLCTYDSYGKIKSTFFSSLSSTLLQKKLSQASSGYIIYTDSESFDIGI